MANNNISKEDIETFKKLRASPIFFIYSMWGLIPQPVRPEYKIKLQAILLMDHQNWMDNIKNIRPEWFCTFEKGKHITWQQWLILLCIEKAIINEAPRKISIASGHGIGKCLSKDTEIMMYNGTIRLVQDIKVGDLLMGDDNTPRKVLSLASGQEEMYRIKYFDGTYYDVNESHVLSLVASQTHGRQKMGDITNVSVKEYLTWSERRRKTNIGYKKSIKLHKKKLLVDPYLLGLWLGDGSSMGGRIFNIDEEIISYLRKVGIGKERIDPRTNCWEASVVGLSTKLNKLKLRNNKHIPLIYLTSSLKQRLELLAGIIDTDGHMIGRQFSVIQKNKKLAEQIKWLAQSVGTHATLNPVKKHCYYKGIKREGLYYLVNISRNTEIIPTKIFRKKSKRNGNEQRDNLHFGFTVESLGLGDYYGFEIDGNRLFMLGDFTITHNTADLSWVILWFLFVNWNSQVPCTAPTADQMYDVLWKELSIWISKMPPSVKAKYDWSRDHIRIKESPETWFARAKTSSKENSEALAGVHADHVLTIADEASAVEERIFNTAEGAWTSGDILVILISNPTRAEGYFYDTHHKLKDNWQTLSFSSIDSPVVDEKYEANIAERHGRDSAEYGIRVLGKFPKDGDMDDTGYVSMFTDADIHEQPDFGEEVTKFRGTIILGVDPAGEGDDKTSFVLRDNHKSKKIFEEAISNPKGIAEKIITFAEKYNIRPRNIVVDSFGVGADVAKEVAILSKGNMNIYSVNCGELSNRVADQELYLNKRAEMYYKLRKWFHSGGEIIENKNLKEELKSIKFKRNTKGKIQLMSKAEMRKKGYKSPNDADALALTFLRSIVTENMIDQEKKESMKVEEDFDAFSVL